MRLRQLLNNAISLMVVVIVLFLVIPLPKEANMNRITQLHVASVFAEAIGRIYEDKPVSPLFV